jgi:prophage regulatory protein
MMAALLSFKALRAKLGDRSRSACYEDIKLGRLPEPIKIGRNNYWSEAVIDSLIENLQEQSND